MKRLLMVGLYLASLSCRGQLYSIASNHNNVLYAGIENPLTITVQNISPKSVIGKTDNGTLTGENGHYVFYTDTGDVAHITLFKKTPAGQVKIGVSSFRVRQLPDPPAHLGTYFSGPIPLNYLRSQAGLRTGHESIYYTRGIPIVSYSLNVIRNGNFVFMELKNEGALFTEQVEAALLKVLPGDSVIFNNILAKRDDSTLTILSPLTFTIKN